MTERELFMAAFAHPDRPRFLADACGADGALRVRVERLLALADTPNAALDTPPFLDTAPPDPSPEAGVVLSERYRLIEPVGHGGMGVVWKAEQLAPVHRLVAVKLVRPEMDSLRVAARFETERQALALMDHPHIARVYDAGTTADARPYFVMEWVDGEPLTRYCDRRGLPLRDRLRVFVRVCEAVHHAHQKGIIHRDIKPSNILVGERDGGADPKVIDFGVAKAVGGALGDAPMTTLAGSLIGTPAYMSPEQAGEGLIDTRTDVYGLGAVLYELLSGTPPAGTDASVLELLRRVREETPPPPSARRVGAADRKLKELDWVVMRCLEKEPARRYDSAGELAREIERFLTGEPVAAGPPSRWYRLRKAAGRNRLLVTVAVAAVALLVAAAAVSTALAFWAIGAERVADGRRQSEAAQRTRAEAAEVDGRRELAFARLAQARAGRLSARPGQRFESLAAISAAATVAHDLALGDETIASLRDEAIACLALPDVRPIRSWEGFPVGSSGLPGFSADLSLYAVSNDDGRIDVRAVDGDRLLARLKVPVGGGTGRPVFSPNGKFLAATAWRPAPTDAGNFFVWDWAADRLVFSPQQRVTGVAGFDFSPDSTRLACGFVDKSVAIVGTNGWAETGRFELTYLPQNIAFSPDGGRVAVANDPQKVTEVWSVSGDPEFQFTSPFGGMSLAWYPDGRHLACGSFDGVVNLLESNRHSRSLRGHKNGVTRVAVSPDGKVLLSSSWDGTTRVWDAWSGEERLRLNGDLCALSADGRTFATRSATRLTLWELDTGAECRMLPGLFPVAIDELALSPDGRWLVTSDTGYRVWDLRAHRLLGTLPGTGAGGVRFHPDGKSLLTSCRDGVYHWAVEHPADDALALRPMARFLPPGHYEYTDLDRAGTRMIVAASDICILIDRDLPPRTFRHYLAKWCTISPNGLWVATGTHNGYGVGVWSGRTGDRIADLEQGVRISAPSFSPDGRWLGVSTGPNVVVFEPETWKEVRRFRRVECGDMPGAIGWSGDGAYLAAGMNGNAVQLFKTAEWTPLAQFVGPGDLPLTTRFTPDGRRLLIGGDTGGVRVWDLPAVRATLSRMKLDWDAPAYPPPPATPPSPTVKLTVDEAEYQRLLALPRKP